MHHKRKRPKNRRAGCLLCKPWKANGYARTAEGGEKFSDRRRRAAATAAVADCLAYGNKTSGSGPN